MNGAAPLQEHEVLSRFRTLLNDFKRPYLQQTEAPGKKGDSADQTLKALDDVFENIHQLYVLLKGVVEAGGKIPDTVAPDSEKGAVLRVFETQGIFPTLRAQPALKESMLRYLTLDLETYPYTLNPKHISMLAKYDIESHQVEIVDNKPDE
jgi:hypothetical protein